MTKYEITYSKETIKKVYNLYIEDLKQQLLELRRNKDKYDYNEYRYIYQRLHNAIKSKRETYNNGKSK